MFYVLENLKVRNVIISYQEKESENINRLLEIVNRKKLKLLIVNKGDKINVEEGVSIDILWPNKDNLIKENFLNNNSIVCKTNYRDNSILFTGDIEEIAEKKILQEYRDSDILNSTILKTAHHGSNTSSTKNFLEAVNPQKALIGVGRDNNFGHPNHEVIERLKELNIIVYRTDLEGEIFIKNFF